MLSFNVLIELAEKEKQFQAELLAASGTSRFFNQVAMIVLIPCARRKRGVSAMGSAQTAGTKECAIDRKAEG